MAETSNAPVEALLQLVKSQLLDVNTAIPGIIVSYANGIAKVLPVGKKRFADGDALDFPVIPNVRVCWPSFMGGTAGIKGPVTPGDKCLLVFSQQAIDGSDDSRMFDLQDAYAVMTDLGNCGQSDSANNTDLTMFFGAAYIRLTPAGALNIHAPGGTNISTPLTTNTGKFTSQGLVTFQDGMTGQGGATGVAISGDITHTGGSITSLGKKIDGSHTHGGVAAGGANTSVPNA